MRRVGLFPGTFDPVTLGHLDILGRALHLFDRMIVAVGQQTQKQPLFSLEERVEMIRESLTPAQTRVVEVTAFDGLLVEFARRRRVGGIVRGLRFVSDFEYEFQMALMNRKLRHTVETVFMMPHERYTYISSRLIKEVASLGAPITGMVPPPVEERLAQKFSSHR